MFDGGGNEVTPLFTVQPGHAKNGKVVAFSAAAGENNFARFASPYGGNAVASVIQDGSSAPANVMDAGRVAENLAQKRQHRLAHRRVQRCGCVVIEVNCCHGKSTANLPPMLSFIIDEFNRISHHEIRYFKHAAGGGSVLVLQQLVK